MVFDKAAWLLALVLAATLLAALVARGRRPRSYAVAIGAAALFLLAGAAAPRIAGRAEGRACVIAVDRSSSVAISLDDESLRTMLSSIADRFDPADRVGLVLFGGRAAVALDPGPPGRFKSFNPGLVSVEPGRTDIRAGLEAAAAMLPASGGEVIIVTDGRDTESAAGSFPTIAARGLRIHAAAAGESPEGDFGIESFEGPSSAAPGSSITLSARVFSRSGGDATVVFEDDSGKRIHSATARFAPGGSMAFRVSTRVEEGDRFFTSRVHTANPPDPWPSNDFAEFALRVGDHVRALYVTDAAPGRLLGRVIGSDPGIRVTESRPFRLGDRPSFALTDVIVLDGTNAQSLGSSRMSAIEAFVRDLGGGLILSGGPAAFGPGGFIDTPIESVSPVRFDPDETPLALALALDASGSMQEIAAQGMRKFDFARAAAGFLLDRLREGDFVEIIPFSETPLSDPALRAKVGPSPPRGVASALDRLVPRGSTSIYRALDAAVSSLSARPEERKHVLLLSDGLENVASDAAAYEEIRSRVESAGISISAAIAQSGARTAETAFLERNVVHRGRVYLVEEYSDLPRDFIEDVARARGELIRRGAFTAERGRAPPGVPLPDAPEVAAFVRTSLKDAGAAALTAGPDREPLFAWTQSGLGRVVVFTSSLDEGFAPLWNKWPGDEEGRGGLRDFFAGWTRWAAGGGRRVGVETSCAGGKASVRASLRSGPPLPDGLRLTARAVSPGRPASERAMAQDGPNSYSCVLDIPGPGLYRVLVLAEPERAVAGEGGFYSGEPAETRLLGPDRDSLRALASGGGRYWPDPLDYVPGPPVSGKSGFRAVGWPLLAASAVFAALSAFVRGAGRRERMRV